jgi:lipopolysaccharide biosynthesis regulator YciM
MYKGDRANMERIMDSLSVMRKRHSFVVPNVENIIRARIQIDEGDYREAIKRLDEIKKVGSYDVRIARENLYIEAYTGLGDIDEANNHRGSLRMIEGDGGAELEKIKAEAERKYGKIQEYRDEKRSGIVREMAKNVGIGVGVLAIVIGVFFVLSRRGRGKKKK